MAQGNLKCKYWKTAMHTSMKQRGEREHREAVGKESQSVTRGERRREKSDRGGVYE